jgi:hypothetical protein
VNGSQEFTDRSPFKFLIGIPEFLTYTGCPGIDWHPPSENTIVAFAVTQNFGPKSVNSDSLGTEEINDGRHRPLGSIMLAGATESHHTLLEAFIYKLPAWMQSLWGGKLMKVLCNHFS